MGHSNPDYKAKVQETDRLAKIGAVVENIKAHPNYLDSEPFLNETPIQYALRRAAHLVSPPQLEDEDYHVECVDVAAAILSLGPQLELAFKNR